MKKRILLTGANGFIGRSLIEGFDKSLYDLFALDFQKEISPDISGLAKYLSLDISKPFEIDMDFDVVIHLAALNQTNINSNFPYEEFRAVNVKGTKNVANSCNFKKIILFSTANMYDKTVDQIDENSPLAPHSFYERSKFEAELVCKESIDQEKLVILRPVNITGIKQANKAIVPFFFYKAVRNEPIEVFVPHNRKIQLLSSKDLHRAVEKIMSDERVNGVFNLSNTDSIEVKGLAEKIVTLCNSQSLVMCTNSNLEKYSEVRSDKAKEVLNWRAQDSIDTIINDYAEFYSLKLRQKVDDI